MHDGSNAPNARPYACAEAVGREVFKPVLNDGVQEHTVWTQEIEDQFLGALATTNRKTLPYGRA